MERLHTGPEVLIDRVLRSEAAGDPVELAGGHLQAHAGLQNSISADAAIVTLLELGRRHEGHPHVHTAWKAIALGHDANDRRYLRVDADLPSNYAWRAAISVLPDAIADHDHRSGAGPIVAGDKAAAQDGAGVQHGKDA